MATSEGMWFGTEDRMMWIPAPQPGASSSPEGWAANGTLIGGGGWAAHSWDTHKTYAYEWSSASSPQVAQLMKSYRDGTYGRGLLYFLDPSTYETNILPARWADPSMALGDESPSLLYGVKPTGTATSGGEANLLPVQSAVYNVTTPAASSPAPDDSLFVPVPPGYSAYLAFMYSYTGTAGVWVTPVNSNGTLGTSVRLPPVANNASSMQGILFSSAGSKGFRIWLGRSSNTASTLTLTALSVRLVKADASPGTLLRALAGPWVGGQGHSGCRFLQPPTYIVNGAAPDSPARIGYAATFTEVGSWVYG